ncbi:GumC family protein [Chitinophaga ginsengisegetis]|uniref:GumC family protein n=1 Tax=Chitinophaga ginsengisegetis TaxID=393003 RepID=UPI000DC01595|nr:polysaccharide biosynthesis tyrosine autokinase [Chitinophaga ginsengisegetis]MDR6570757.1 capsular exopolysaccharide synthesis family protein [Chitinophaga ginsengisegetis]MDR6650491.1 capsular exopolysaccharide synthesis family protein [Chitinophaga ginsengisegetis]MDR6656870.1 capsular exopolysaccharide synthesis family protein [Chitinophaga ginsengisegetis]
MNQPKPTNNRNSVIDLNDLFQKIVFHWPLYLLVLMAMVTGAMLYLKYKKPIYMSSAKLYLKDEKKGGGEEMDALKSLALFNNGKNIENEMEVLKSPILVEKVIAGNGFNIRYYIKGTVKNEEIYNHPPLHLRVLGDSSKVGNYTFDVTRENDLLKIKQVNYTADTSLQLTARTGEPFTVGKDKFVITFPPLTTGTPTNTFRIRVDSVPEYAYEKIEEIGTALVNRDATVILVSYKDPVPERTADFLNSLLEAYNDYTLDDKNKVAFKTIHFLAVRIDSLKEELGLLEKQEENFKIQRGITDIDASSKLALEQVKEADIRLSEANLQLSVFDQVDGYISNPSSDYPFAPVLGNIDQTLTSMINRYEEALREKKRLSLSLKPTSDILQNVESQITDTRKTIKDYIAGYRRNADVVQRKTQAKVNQIQGKIANIPTYAKEYINIKRQQGVKENLYLYLLKKKEEASVAYASNVVDNKVIAPAFVPDKPITPKKSLVFIGFIAAGLVLTSAYIYLKYFLNPSVLSKKEIEQVFDLPVIAEIYQQEEGARDMSLQNRSVLVEQVFNMRTNLKFLLTGITSTPTILLTSSISGEGKTFLSAHLGNSLTVSNKKVVLLELDLRKPKLSQFLGLDHNVGVTNYIIGNKTIEEIIKKVPGTDGLYVVSSGPIPPNPIELIEGERMADLLAQLKDLFDYVVIDMSPIGIVSDAKSISHQVDCALFVVRYNFTLKSKLIPVSENIRKGFFKKTGIIFNGIEQDTFYPYYYYDHYSYTENKQHNHTWLSLMKKIKQRIA